MCGGHQRHDKGLFSHLAGHCPPQYVAYPPPGGYPPAGYPSHGGYASYVYPPFGGYPLVPAYQSSSVPCYPGHGGMRTFFAGGAAAVAHHMAHGHNHGSHGYGHYGHYHGKYKHGKFKHGKFGKRWKHKMWK